MGAFGKLRTWSRESLTPALGLRSFTALLGVKPNQHEALSEHLAQFDRQQQRKDFSVPGLHGLRLILFSPTENNRDHAPDAPMAVLFHLAFDGQLDDVLEEIVRLVPDEVLQVLRQCEGFYDEFGDPLKYLKRREVPCGYLFRDLGPFAARQDSARIADPTLAEQQSAARVMNSFASFYAQHPPVQSQADAEPLRRAFLEKFDLHAGRGKLHPLEVRQPEEDRWARLAAEMMRRKHRRVARRINDRVLRRAAHAKAHGLVHARFRVCDSKYRVGLFDRVGEEFHAVLRPSNASEELKRDRKIDARGLAISLSLPKDSGTWLGEPGRQDFLMMDGPIFASRNVRNLVRVLAVAEMRPLRRMVWYALRLLLRPNGVKQLGIIARSFRRPRRHPLVAEFHSAVPYQLGDDHVAKYSLEPSDATPIQGSRLWWSLTAPFRTRGDDFLSAALENSTRGGVTLDFFVHVLAVSGDEKRKKRLEDAVEDATLDWRRLRAEKVKVATIEIGRQSETAAARAEQAERWAFNPWNALEQHRPLGSLNRARRRAYKEGAALRAAGGFGFVSVPPASREQMTSDPEPGSEAAE